MRHSILICSHVFGTIRNCCRRTGWSKCNYCNCDYEFMSFKLLPSPSKVYWHHCYDFLLFAFFSYLSLSDCLDVLDVSGNVSLGNRGTLQLLNACSSRFSLEEDNFKLDLNLVACGIESPLSDEFIRIVQLLKHTGRDETIAHALFKVDLSGNLIDKREMNLFS